MSTNWHKVEIRPSTASDVEMIASVAAELPQWFTPAGLEHVRIDAKYQPGFVAVREGTIIGFITFYVSEGIGHIGWLGVSPNYHRRGIGRLLVERLCTQLKRDGVREMQVCTLGDSVEYEPYERTRAFYRALGFRDLSRVMQDNPECPELLTLKRDL